MIYEFPSESDPIRQGDIFLGLPRMDISLNEIVVYEEGGERETSWAEIAQDEESVNILVPVRSVAAVVATQDCDAVRSRDITLCEIREFRDVEPSTKDTKSAKAWISRIIQQARINQKWFYLPPDEQIGFKEKMAVDFLVTLRIPREDLESLRSLRKGRLNPVADEHFRERIAEFFRRYPYDEWYPLNQEELATYAAAHEGTKPYPWQNFTGSVEKS